MFAPQVPTPPLPPEVPDPQVIIASGPPEWIAPVAVMTLLIIVGAIVLYPLVRAWARRIEQRGQDPALLDEVQTLRDRVADLEQSVARMHEIEDRMDFAERMLTQRAEQARLPEQGGR